MRRFYGSSPRSRGTPMTAGGTGRGVRFIPALAGNTLHTALIRRGPAVHPRARGEHKSLSCLRSSAVGSSPRSRGTLRGRIREHGGARFIPALAGNTGAPISRPS
ncbi:Hypothetical protein HVIM_04553 (plasmid) [Roseomonas mucosa]|nr:Hypothetical protein HVIM_04553 [Roseomonas mucosa]